MPKVKESTTKAEDTIQLLLLDYCDVESSVVFGEYYVYDVTIKYYYCHIMVIQVLKMKWSLSFGCIACSMFEACGKEKKCPKFLLANYSYCLS